VIGGTVAVPRADTLSQFAHDKSGAEYYRDLRMCNVTLPGITRANEELTGKEKDWFQGYFYPDGTDEEGNAYWQTLPVQIIERFGNDTWMKLKAVGQDRINRSHLHTWDGTQFDAEPYQIWFVNCKELGAVTSELPGDSSEKWTAAQNKNDTPAQPKGQYSIGHYPHLQCGGKYQRVLRLTVWWWNFNADYYVDGGKPYWEDREQWLKHFTPYMPIYELLVAGYMHQANWIASKLGQRQPYPKAHANTRIQNRNKGKGKGKGNSIGKGSGKGKAANQAHIPRNLAAIPADQSRLQFTPSNATQGSGQHSYNTTPIPFNVAAANTAQKHARPASNIPLPPAKKPAPESRAQTIKDLREAGFSVAQVMEAIANGGLRTINPTKHLFQLRQIQSIPNTYKPNINVNTNGLLLR
jgi:hypothetical protein